MQNTDKKQDSINRETPPEASFGVSRYKRNYDRYAENSSAGKTVGTVISVAVFAVLLIGLSLFVANTILQTKGMSLFSFFEQQTAAETESEAASQSEQNAITNVTDVSSQTVTLEITVPSGLGVRYGSGVILTSDGYIMTDSSLISGAIDITATFKSGVSASAYAVGLDESKGVCVIKTYTEGLSAADIGDSSSVAAGDTLYASSPESSAINEITVVSRETVDGAVRLLLSGLASDLAGSPVLNADGEVVALTDRKDGENVIAVPVSEALPFINKMINLGGAMFEVDGDTSAVNSLGITVKAVTDELSGIYNIPVGCFVVNALGVRNPIKQGDIIVSCNGEDVRDSASLTSALENFPSGGKLRIYRTNDYIEIEWQN